MREKNVLGGAYMRKSTIGQIPSVDIYPPVYFSVTNFAGGII